jgi:tRNA-Thr(GGU) m(6)t(6)A37 methyltransferase TsaA
VGRILLNIFLFLLLGAVISSVCIRGSAYQISSIGLIKKKGGTTTIEIDKRYKDALLGLNDFSHVIVCYWFHENDTEDKRAILMVHPRGDPHNPLCGVFATRAPTRPNLIGISLCKIVSIKGNIIQIDIIDAHNGSPVIDLKPYIPYIDSIADAKVPESVRERPLQISVINRNK